MDNLLRGGRLRSICVVRSPETSYVEFGGVTLIWVELGQFRICSLRIR